jgi:PAS domain S-box-containing protein
MWTAVVGAWITHFGVQEYNSIINDDFVEKNDNEIKQKIQFLKQSLWKQINSSSKYYWLIDSLKTSFESYLKTWNKEKLEEFAWMIIESYSWDINLINFLNEDGFSDTTILYSKDKPIIKCDFKTLRDGYVYKNKTHFSENNSFNDIKKIWNEQLFMWALDLVEVNWELKLTQIIAVKIYNEKTGEDNYLLVSLNLDKLNIIFSDIFKDDSKILLFNDNDEVIYTNVEEELWQSYTNLDDILVTFIDDEELLIINEELIVEGIKYNLVVFSRKKTEINWIISATNSWISTILAWIWFVAIKTFIERKQKIKIEKVLEEELEKEELEKEKIINENNKRISSILEISKDVLFETNLEWIILWTNSNVFYNLWYKEHEIIWKHICDLIEQEDKILFMSVLDSLVKWNFTNEWYIELRLLNNENNIVFFEMWIIVSDDWKKISYIFKNIDVRKQMWKIMSKQNKDLEKANKKEIELRKQIEILFTDAKWTMSTISHEYRNLLTAILSSKEMLKATSLTIEQKNILNNISNSWELMIDLSNSMLDLAKIREWKLQIENIKFDFWSYIDDIFYILYPQIKQKWLDLIIDIDPAVYEQFLWDPTRIRIILLNLLNNAAKFTKKWSITVRIYINEETDNYSNIHFEIIDTGIWIKPENREKIFEAYTQESSDVSRKFGWTWLWLTLVNELINLMWWEIKICSKEWKWTKFCFNLTLEKTLWTKNIEQYKWKTIILISNNLKFKSLVTKSAKYIWAKLNILDSIEWLDSYIKNNDAVIVAWNLETEVFNTYWIIENLYYAWYEVKNNQTIYLPITFQKIKKVLENKQDNEETVTEIIKEKREKILIWEDDYPVSMLLKKILEKRGFTHIDIFTNQKDLVSAFKNNEYNLVFLDNSLENKSLWYEVSAIMREIENWDQDRKRATIISSSWDISEKLSKLNKDNWMDGVCYKPFKAKELDSVLEKFL